MFHKLSYTNFSLADHCDPNPCNSGTCNADKPDTANGLPYSCTCPDGYNGPHCENSKSFDTSFIFKPPPPIIKSTRNHLSKNVGHKQ